jgi:hypothetical protein
MLLTFIFAHNSVLGVVWEAEDTSLGRPLSEKMPTPTFPVPKQAKAEYAKLQSPTDAIRR